MGSKCHHCMDDHATMEPCNPRRLATLDAFAERFRRSRTVNSNGQVPRPEPNGE